MTDTASISVREGRWPEDESDLQALRTTVFVREQGVPVEIEWDGQDALAQHVIAEIDGEMAGCGRLLPDGRIGRLAVLLRYRGQGIGAQLLDALIKLSYASGLPQVHLHAQSDAVPFYTRAGFDSRGEPFYEAGIEHLDMHRALDYRDCEHNLTGITYPQPFAQLVIAQARLARRELAILSPTLDHRIFHDRELSAALGTLMRGGRRNRLRILVGDPRPLVQRGHSLLQLARRLPSRVELRSLREHPDWDGDTAILRDRDSLLALPSQDTKLGFYRPGDRGRCESALLRYETLWNASRVDPELRALSL